MKQEFEPQNDELAKLRLAWQEHKRRVHDLPGLSDEELEQLYADYCERHGEVGPLEKHRVPAWQQVVSAVVCLAAAGYCTAGCVRMWGDWPCRLLLWLVAFGSLICAIWSIFPHLWTLSHLYRQERFEATCADGRLSYYGPALRSIMPLGVSAFIIFLLTTQMTVGDGYYIATLRPDRLAAVGFVTDLLYHMA